MNLSSLRTRSLLTVLCVVLPALLIYVILGHAHVSHQLGRRLDGRMGHELRMLKEAVERSDGDNQRLREIVDITPVDMFPQRRQYGIWIDGQLVLATDDLPFRAMPNAASGYSDLSAVGAEWRVLAEYLPASDATHGRRVALMVVDPMDMRLAL